MSGDEREQRICDNIGLVHSCARRFLGRGEEYDDLFSAGCIGLCKAVDSFDESRGFRFSTYAVPVILGEIRRLFRDGGTVKVGRSTKELSIRLLRERDAYAARCGREPSIGELAALTGVSPETAAAAMNAALPTLSLTREDDDGGYIDLPVPSVEESLTDHMALRQVLADLPACDRALIVLRYLKSETQQATADYLGMTQVQVSRRERRLLQELRRRLAG